MKKSMSPIITGLAAGAVIGTAAYVINNKSHHNSTGKTL